MSNLYDLLRRDVFDSRDILEKIDELKSEALIYCSPLIPKKS